VMTTLKAKGVFPESHALSLGVYGPGGHPSAYDYLAAGIDTLLVLGASLGQMQTDSWSTALQPRRMLIQVDVDAISMGRNYAVDLAITAPVGQFCAALRWHLPPVRLAASAGVRYHAPTERAPDGAAVLPLDLAIRELQQALPADTIYCIDNGEHQFFAVHHLCIDEPDGFVAMTGLGSMGCSLGGAIGVQLAKPGRTVAVLCGDGGFAMFGNDISTAAELGLPLVVCVLNNGRFGMVEHGHEQAFGRQPMYALGPHDIRTHATSLGAAGAAAAVPGAITWALRRRPKNQPLVIDVQIEPLAAFAKNDRIASDIKNSAGLTEAR